MVATSGVRVDVVADERGLRELRPGWSALLATSADASPYLTWEWADTWWRSFGGGDRLHVAVARRGDEVVGVAPLLRCGPLVGRAPTVYVGLGHESADYGGALLGTDPASGAALAGHVGGLVRRGACVVLPRLVPEGGTLPALRAERRLVLTSLFEEEYPYLDLPEGEDGVRLVERLWKKNDVRRRLKRLEQSSVVTFDYDRPPEDLEVFLRLHSARWQQKGQRPAGLFATDTGQRFLRALVPAGRDAGWLHLSRVDVDGAPAAARVGFELGGVYHGVKSAFDPALRDHGPGHLVVGFLLREALARGVHRFDFMRGEGAHKHQWTTTSRPVGYWVAHRGGRAGDLQTRYAWAVLRWRNRRRFAAG